MLCMEALLRRERDRLSAAAESSMDAFYICEAVRTPEGEMEDFIFTYLNTNVEKMVSIPRDVLLRGKMCELLPINRTLGLSEEYKRVVLTGKPYVAEFPIQAENVTSEWIRAQAVRLEDGVAKATCGLQAAVRESCVR
jgi:PAS domain-containing protein